MFQISLKKMCRVRCSCAHCDDIANVLHQSIFSVIRDDIADIRLCVFPSIDIRGSSGVFPSVDSQSTPYSSSSSFVRWLQYQLGGVVAFLFFSYYVLLVCVDFGSFKLDTYVLFPFVCRSHIMSLRAAGMRQRMWPREPLPNSSDLRGYASEPEKNAADETDAADKTLTAGGTLMAVGDDIRESLGWRQYAARHAACIKGSIEMPLRIQPVVGVTGGVDDGLQVIVWWMPDRCRSHGIFLEPDKVHTSIIVAYFGEGTNGADADHFIEMLGYVLNDVFRDLCRFRLPVSLWSDAALFDWGLYMSLKCPPDAWRGSWNFAPDDSWVYICEVLQDTAVSMCNRSRVPRLSVRRLRKLHIPWV